MEKSMGISNKHLYKAEELSHFFNHLSSGFALFEIILNKSGEPINVHFLAVNKAFEKNWGMKASQIVGKTGKQIKANFKKPLLQTFAKVALTGKTARAEYFRKDLERSFALEVFSPEKGLLATIINDITEQKELEESLHDSEISYRRLFEASKEGILILDAVSGKVVDVNPYLIEMLGISYSDILGNKLWELGFFKDIASNKARFLDLQKNKYVRYEDLPLETATGKTFPVEFISNVYLVGHKRVIQCNIRDITERKQMEEKLAVAMADALRSNEEMVKALRSNQELEHFAYVASHDLQEPLRMVSSYAQLLAQRYANQLDEKALKYINYAVDGATRMQGMINDLLTYSRINTRVQPLELIDTHAILGEAIRNLFAVIEENRAIITNDDLPTIRTNPAQLLQVFQNLVANAIKFHGKNPPRVHVSVQDMGNEWKFSVKDNGLGIEKKYEAKLFVIFSRLHTQEEYPGTGIGLAICKRVIEQHGGRIWFESKLGKGSTFYFSLPK